MSDVREQEPASSDSNRDRGLSLFTKLVIILAGLTLIALGGIQLLRLRTAQVRVREKLKKGPLKWLEHSAHSVTRLKKVSDPLALQRCRRELAAEVMRFWEQIERGGPIETRVSGYYLFPAGPIRVRIPEDLRAQTRRRASDTLKRLTGKQVPESFEDCGPWFEATFGVPYEEVEDTRFLRKMIDTRAEPKHCDWWLLEEARELQHRQEAVLKARGTYATSLKELGEAVAGRPDFSGYLLGSAFPVTAENVGLFDVSSDGTAWSAYLQPVSAPRTGHFTLFVDESGSASIAAAGNDPKEGTSLDPVVMGLLRHDVAIEKWLEVAGAIEEGRPPSGLIPILSLMRARGPETSRPTQSGRWGTEEWTEPHWVLKAAVHLSRRDGGTSHIVSEEFGMLLLSHPAKESEWSTLERELDLDLERVNSLFRSKLSDLDYVPIGPVLECLVELQEALAARPEVLNQIPARFVDRAYLTTRFPDELDDLIDFLRDHPPTATLHFGFVNREKQ